MTSLQRYIDSIKPFGRVTKDEEKKLARIIFYSRNLKHVKEAKEKMAHCNLLLVVDRAIRYSNVYGLRESDLMDLISEGNIGLMRAVELYRSNHKSGAGFATYAIFHIDQKISRFIKMNKFLRIPEHYLRLRKKLDELESKHGDKLTNKIVRKELAISQEVLETLKEKRNKSVMFLEDIFDEEGGSWEEILRDESSLSPYQINCSKSLKDFLDKYISLLGDREIEIIRYMHYSEKEMTLGDISKLVHISRERVRQIYIASLRKLRVYMIRGLDVDKIKKPSRYDKRGLWGCANKSMEEQEKCVKNIMDNLSIL